MHLKISKIPIQHNPIARLADPQMFHGFIALTHRKMFGLWQHLMAISKMQHRVHRATGAGGRPFC